MRKKHFLALLLTLLIVFGSPAIVSAESAQTMNSNVFSPEMPEYELPEEIGKGSNCQMKGTIRCAANMKITKVVLMIDGKAFKETKNSSCSFDLSKFHSNTFAGLKEGTYKLEIVAYSGFLKCVVASASIKVTSSFSASISGYIPPSKIALGCSYTLKGKITAASEILKVAVLIDGKVKAEAVCGSKTFSMSKIDSKIKFETLGAGEHTIKIVAYGKHGGSKTVAEHKFKVTNISFGPGTKERSVSEKSLAVINHILKNASVKSCKITKTEKSPYEQACEIYYNCSKSGGVKKQKEVCGPNDKKVIEVFEKEKAKPNGLRGEALIEKMMQKICELGSGNVSKLCADNKKVNVFQISYGSVSNKTSFKKALTEYEKNNKGTFCFKDKPENSCFHIEIKQ